MTHDDLERQLEDARQQIEAAGPRLAARHQGGEQKDYPAAYDRVHSLRLRLAMARGEEYAAPSTSRCSGTSGCLCPTCWRV